MLSAGSFWRSVRTLLVQRQPALVYSIAAAAILTAIDLGVVAARHRFGSFSAFSRVEFDGTAIWRGLAALGHSSATAWLPVVLAFLVGAVVTAWLRGCYIVALGDGRYTWRPTALTLQRLTVYSILFGLIELAFVGLSDNDLAAVAVVVLLVTTPFTLYADYAIVLDEIGVAEGIRRSVRVLRQRLGASALAVLGLVFYFPLLVAAAFSRGFTDSTHVQPAYLLAWLLAIALVQFVTDAVLLTLYRTTRLSEGGSGGPPAESRPPEASD